MSITLPESGSHDWDVPLNNALLQLQSMINDATGDFLTKTTADTLYDALGMATTAVTNHVAATDPHGDRANAATLYAAKSNNLSDLGSASSARTNLGLGGAATLSVGTTTGTVAAGDDARFTSALQKSSNLSDVASASTARTNLGLGTSATRAVGTTSGTVAAGDDSRFAAPNIWLPADYGWLAWTQDPFFGSGSFTLTLGTIFLSKITLRQAATISNIIVAVVTAGATLTAGECLAGLYDTSGNLLATTGDQSTNWTSTGTKTMALTTPYAASAGFYYVALLTNGTTAPVISAGPTPASGTAAAIGLGAGTARYLSGPTSQTSLPSTITMGSASVNTGTKWCAVS